MITRSTVVLLLVSLAARASAAESPTPDLVTETPPTSAAASGNVCGPGTPLDYLLTMSGGSSRGAYQAGFAYALAATFRGTKAAGRVETASTALPPDDPLGASKMLGISGVSIGAVNAVMTAVAACMDGEPMSVDDNPLWQLWRDLDWDRLFPGDRSCSEYAARFPELDLRCGGPNATPYRRDDGVFALGGIQPLRAQLLRLLSLRGKLLPSCHVPVVVTLATDDPGAAQANFEVGKLTIPSSRRYTGFVIETSQVAKANEGGVSPAVEQKIQVCDLPAAALARAPENSGLFFGLPRAAPSAAGPETGCQPLALSSVIDMLVASVALPPLFEPQTLAYCTPRACDGSTARGLYCSAGDNLCDGRFSDGSFFDRTPLGGAIAIQNSGTIPGLPGSPTQGTPDSQPQRCVSHVVIDARRRLDEGKPQVPPPARGSIHLGRQLDNFMEVSGNLELQMLSRYGKLASSRIDPSRRDAPIVGDLEFAEDVPLLQTFMDGMGAFLNVDYRRFDYYVGLADGARWLAEQQAATQKPGPNQAWTRWRDNALQRVGTLDSPGAAAVAAYVRAGELSKGAPSEGDAVMRKSLDTLLGPWRAHFMERAPSQRGECASPLAPGDDSPGVVRRMFRLWHGLRFAGARGSAPGSFKGLARYLDRCGAFAGERPAFVANYDQWEWTTARLATKRLEALEHLDGNDGTAAASTGVEYLAAIQAGRSSLALDVGPNTVPDRLEGGTRWGAMTTRLLIPSTLTGDGRHGGLRLGWEPLAYYWSWCRLVLAPQLQWQTRPIADDGEMAYGGALAWALNGARRGWPDLGLRAIAWYLPGRPGDFGNQLSGSGEIFYRPLWSRVELYFGARGLPCFEGDWSACGPRLSFGFGLADVNGLVYWLLHAFSGDDSTYASLGPSVVGLGTTPAEAAIGDVYKKE